MPSIAENVIDQKSHKLWIIACRSICVEKTPVQLQSSVLRFESCWQRHEKGLLRVLCADVVGLSFPCRADKALRVENNSIRGS